MMMDNDYNEIPVFYCKDCLSLKIINISQEDCYCEECGSTNIEQTTIKNWEELYQKQFGYKFLDWKNPNYRSWISKLKENKDGREIKK